MLGKTHAIGAFTASTAICAITPQIVSTTPLTGANIVLFVGAAVVGGLLPDIDSKGSSISRYVRPLRWIYKWLSKIGEIFRIDDFSHRGIMHTLLVPAILAFVYHFCSLSRILSLIVLGILVGYLSHLLLDLLNPKGIPLFAPIVPKKLRILPRALAVDTGRRGEKIVRLVLFAGGTVFVAVLLAQRVDIIRRWIL